MISGIIDLMSFFHRHHHIDPVEELLEDVVILLKQIRDSLRPQKAVAFIIRQIGESPMPVQGPVTGIVVGQTGTFLAIPVDANGNEVPVPAGTANPTWTSDTSNATVTSSPDGLTASVVAASDPTLAGTSFNLTISATVNGSVVSNTIPVPFLSASTGAFVGFVITQTS